MRALAAFLLLMACQTATAQPQSFERCIACHSGKDGSTDLGPNLAGVFGRKAGSREDFRYSRALSRSSIVWDEKSLNGFLKAPDQFIPGTRMPFEGLASDADRAAVIQYLKSLTR